MDNLNRVEVANKVSIVTIIANVILSAVKVSVGFIGNSSAMIADGIHSLSDVFSTFIAMLGIKWADKEGDESHPYGHEKIEPVMGKLLANILLVTAAFMAYKGINNIVTGSYQVPGQIAIYAAILSILVKEWMYRYTAKTAKKIESSALMADAWHHRSDSLSSIGSLIGIAGARMGYSVLDPLASVVISVFVGKVAIDIYLQSVKELIDSSADKDTVSKIEDIIMSTNGVIEIDDLKTRLHANKLYVDVEIAVNNSLTVLEGHDIAERVHDNIEEKIKRVKHCMVHVNPLKEK